MVEFMNRHITNCTELNNYLLAITNSLDNMRHKNIKPSKNFFENLFLNLKILIPVDRDKKIK